MLLHNARCQGCLSERVGKSLRVRSRAWFTKLREPYLVLTIDVYCTVILFAAYLLPWHFLILLMKREIFRKFKIRFRQWHDNLIDKHYGKTNTIWSEFWNWKYKFLRARGKPLRLGYLKLPSWVNKLEICISPTDNLRLVNSWSKKTLEWVFRQKDKHLWLRSRENNRVRFRQSYGNLICKNNGNWSSDREEKGRLLI